MGNLLSVFFSNRQIQPTIEDSEEDDDFLPARGMETENWIFDTCSDTCQDGQNRISISDVNRIEDALDFNEKVSMVYLLYDSAEVALEHLIRLQDGVCIKVLQEWVMSVSNKSWDTKLLEALAIIQNYQILCRLGFTMNDINERFLPLNDATTIEIDKTKKKLYRLCENLVNPELDHLLHYVKEDFRTKRMDFRTFNYLELYLLHWTKVEYITPTNFSNLANILKWMEMFQLSEYLKSIGQPVQSNNLKLNSRNIDVQYLDYITEAQLLGSVHDVPLVTNSQDRIRRNNSYYINEDKPGVCLIINQEKFYTEPDPSLEHLLPKIDDKLEDRDGTSIDRNCIKKTMEKFGFEVIVEDNLDHWTVIDTVKNAVNQVTMEHSSFFIYILSHGAEGKIYGHNSIPVEVNEIQRIICQTNVKNMSGKPKVIIIQACQGTECQEVLEFDNDENNIQMDGPTAHHRPTPKAADVLVFWATVPGYGAIRDKKKGTWFIQSFCDKLEQQASEFHLEDICTRVIQEVINKRWGIKTMVPIKESTLSASFYLPKFKL